MKKLFIALIGLAVALPALAQQHQSRSFLAGGVSAIYLTNTYNPTNLNTAGSRGTNLTGFSFTNLNRLVTINDTSGATNVTASRINPFQDVALWSLRDGSPAVSYSYTTNGGLGLNYAQSFATLSITWVGGSGANTAVPFVFTPVYDGVNEATSSAEEWSVSLTPSTTASTLVTNVPLHKWPGAAKLRLRRIVNTDTDANGHAIVTAIRLNGYPP